MVYVSPYVRQCKSHPDKLASVHTLGVCTRALDIWDDYRARTSSLFHDVGKVINVNFSQRFKGINTPGVYYNHAYLSLLSFLNYLRVRGRKFDIEGVIKSYSDFLIISACIVKHHGALPNFSDLINRDELQRLKGYLAGSPHMPADEFLSLVKLEKGLCNFSVQDLPNKSVLDLFVKTRDIQDRIGLDTGKVNPLDFFLDLRMCFSTLVAADKGDAGSQNVDEKEHERFLKTYEKRVNKYIATKKPTTELNRVRTEMREVAMRNLKIAMDNNPEQKLFSLTYPTGAGKTLMLLSLASEILKRKGMKRVIYSVPFLSITEQIFGIIEDAFEGQGDCIKRIDCKAQPDKDLIYDDAMENSSLMKRFKAFFRKVLKGKSLRDEVIEGLLRQDYQESTFNYPMIVTTFVQFFQAFTTCSNRGLMRFSYLKDSVLLIDEIQAVSPGLYSFFVAMIDAFCQRFGSYAIISTATMPYFKIPAPAKNARIMFSKYREPIEIGDLSYYEHHLFNRYEINALPGRYDTSTLSARLAQEQVPTLAVLNTVRDSRDVYDTLRSTVDCPVYLLNSNFYAEDRRVILNKCKAHLKARERFFLVSTQLIEAGVDIDFDVTFRDIAPLPNVIQTSGRCNREGLRSRGQVYLFKLYDDEGRLRAGTIYQGIPDGPFLDYADQVFFQGIQTVFQEKELLPLQKGFFKQISQDLRFGEWGKDERGKELNFIGQICDFKYGDMGQYTVIPKIRYGIQEQFYIPRDSEDKTYEELVDLMGEMTQLEDSPTEEGVDKIREVLYLKKKIHEHVRGMMDRVVQVNLRDESIVKDLSEYEEMYCHIYKAKPGHYDSEYGFHV